MQRHDGPSLKSVITSHKKYKRLTELPFCLGDGYLYNFNPVFRKSRDLVSQCGVKFTTNDFCEYATLPLASLPAILKKKKIPVFDNVRALARLERLKPNRIPNIEWCTTAYMKENHVMHESAHCISNHIFKKSLFGGKPLKTHQWIVLEAMMGESLANTVELMGSFYATNLTHQWFYSKSSSQAPFHTDQWRALQDILPRIGYQALFKLIYFRSLHANFLLAQVAPKVLSTVIPLLDMEVSTNKMLTKKMLFIFNSVTSRGNFLFRTYTASFYFRYFLNITKPVTEILDYDFMKVFTADSLLTERLCWLAKYFEEGHLEDALRKRHF